MAWLFQYVHNSHFTKCVTIYDKIIRGIILSDIVCLMHRLNFSCYIDQSYELTGIISHGYFISLNYMIVSTI